MKNHSVLMLAAGLTLLCALLVPGCENRIIDSGSFFQKPAGNAPSDNTSYTVTYHANEAGGTPPAAQTAASGTSVTVAEPSGLTYTGKIFSGWNTISSGGGALYAAGSTLVVTANVDLYAQWITATPTTYTITYNANGGSGTAPVSQTAASGTSVFVAGQGSLIYSGKTFDGWNTISTGGGTPHAVGSSLIVTANITLYAQWITATPATYTVTYNANGGSGTAPSSQTAASGTSVTVAASSGLTYSGKVFSGWNTSSTGGGSPYAAGASLVVTADIDLYAQWITATPTIYTVTYNANGGSGTAPVSQTAASGTSVFVAGQGSLSYSGKTFDGWNTSSTGGGTPYAAGSSLVVSANVDLYAQWITAAPTTYTVTYHANGGSGTAPSSQTVNTGTSVYVAGQGSLIYSGKTFDGWNTSSTGGGAPHAAGSSLTVTADITLYAQWITATTPTSVEISISAIDDWNGLLAQEYSAVKGSSQDFTVSGSYDTYQWYLNGLIQSGVTGSTYTLNTASMNEGVYEVMVVVSKNGESRSGRCRFIILGQGTIPAVPANVSATAQSSSSIRITWTQAAGMTYTIYRSGSANGVYAPVQTGVGSSPYNDSTGLEPYTRYYYKVTAKNGANIEGIPGASTATTYPGVPGNVSATAESSTSIRITWTGVSGAVKYTIYRSESAYGTYTPVSSTVTTSPYINNTGLSSSKTYYYKVSAVDNLEREGTQSGYVSATTNSAVSIGVDAMQDVTLSPATATLTVTQTQVFTVTGSFITGGVSYQWYWDGERISGAAASTYTVNAGSAAAGVHQVTVVVINAQGEQRSGRSRVIIRQ
jgi:uncharacterized repeat protein (TIGR02543 family)